MRAREALEESGEVPEITGPYVYEQHVEMEDDEEDEDGLHKFFLKVLVKMELEDRMSAVKVIGNNIRKALNEMAASTARAEDKANGRTTASLRIRSTQHAGLSRLFSDTLVAYNTSQLEYRERCKERIQRQLLIANKHTTDEELEEMLESGNASVFTGDIVVATQEARQALADIEARHHEIITLEKNIRELRDLFLEMAALVETQGEMIDRIEQHVQSAQEYVHEAEKQTKKAVVYRSKARKKLIIIIIVVLILLLILALIIYFSVAPTTTTVNTVTSKLVQEPAATTKPATSVRNSTARTIAQTN
ncbi:hypothetical protein B566_EDAN000881 [Ephemera danica]|nr:hypothetical protein B566_EDAN000881 [Ephemera danica]